MSRTFYLKNWWRIGDSNSSPSECKSDALPDELIPQITGAD